MVVVACQSLVYRCSVIQRELRLDRDLFYSHPLPGMAGNHPNYYLLGFSAALAPKFPPMGCDPVLRPRVATSSPREGRQQVHKVNDEAQGS